MELEYLISRNRSIMPFLMHCMNILCQKHPEFKNHNKMEEFFTLFIKNKTESLEKQIVDDAWKFLSK
ncbi:MAG: hypothetical protein ACTSVY_01755 [Candidatus Helarchaeota archaeon]